MLYHAPILARETAADALWPWMIIIYLILPIRTSPRKKGDGKETRHCQVESEDFVCGLHQHSDETIVERKRKNELR